MYTLMYRGDPETVSDAASVVFTLPQNACYDITEMCDLFDRFLKATGYYPPANSALEYVDYSYEYKTEEAEETALGEHGDDTAKCPTQHGRSYE